MVEYLKGRKTYLVSLAIVAIAALSYFGVIPEPNVLIGAAVAIAALAATFRAAIAEAIDAFNDLS